MPTLLVSSYNPLSAVDPIRKECILRELGRAHILCLQGTNVRHSGENCTQQNYKNHVWYDWGAPSGKQNTSGGVAIILRSRVFQPKNVARVYCPPDALQGRFGAIRLRRGDLDLCVISMYMYTEPQKQSQQERNLRLWRYLDDFISKLPHRCTPLLCLDANAHVGLVRGPGGEWGSLQSTAVGSFFPEPQNFNGGLFLSILEKHFLVAANTFFEVGPTFYGPPPRRHATRVDYICVPASCLQTVARCHVQYKAADRLQIICDSARRDHVPLQMEITLRLEYVGSAQKVEQQWDQETLTRDALSGRRRHILLNAVETKLAEKFGEVGAAQVDSPDRLWKHFATAIREAVSETYPPQTRQTKSRPRDTQDAVEAMLCSRALLVSYRPLVLGKGRFHLDGVHTPCLHQALHDLLHVWRLSANYRRARKRMDICTKRDAKEKHDNILQDFQRAWQQRDLHQVWRLSRALSGKRIGPKRRRYDAAKTVNPSQQEWMAFLQNEGPAGGCNANEVHWDDIVGNAENHTAVYLDYWTARRRAQQDLLGLRKSAQYASLRKMCPPWGIPTEVWRQLLLPQWKVDSVRCGVGFRASPPSPTLFNRILLHLLTSIRMFNRMPHEWQRSHTTGLDKHNGKEGPAGLRLINNLEVLGKWYCASLWRRGCAHSQRDYASGYIRGKSRIAAMLQQCALQSRLRGHRVSHCLSLLDVSNAFPSPTRASLRMAVSNVARPHDAALLQQRHDQTYMCIPARDADLCVQPGSGALQGDTVACSLFLEVYHPPLDKWLRETQQPELLVVDPVSGRLVDISVSSYADDVARCSVSESSEELYLHLSYSNEVLDKELLEIGLQQNTEKQEHVVFLLVRVLKVSLLMCTKTGCFQEERALMPNTWVVGDILKVATILKYVLVDGQLKLVSIPWENFGPEILVEQRLSFFLQWCETLLCLGWNAWFLLTLNTDSWMPQFANFLEKFCGEMPVERRSQPQEKYSTQYLTRMYTSSCGWYPLTLNSASGDCSTGSQWHVSHTCINLCWQQFLVKWFSTHMTQYLLMGRCMAKPTCGPNSWNQMCCNFSLLTLQQNGLWDSMVESYFYFLNSGMTLFALTVGNCVPNFSVFAFPLLVLLMNARWGRNEMSTTVMSTYCSTHALVTMKMAPLVLPPLQRIKRWLCTFVERLAVHMEKFMITSVLQYAINVLGVGTFLLVSGSPKTTFLEDFSMAGVGAVVVHLRRKLQHLDTCNVPSVTVSSILWTNCIIALFLIFDSIWLKTVSARPMAWFQTVHDGQPAVKLAKHASADDQPDTKTMLDVMAKLCLKNSLEIREMQAAVLRTYLVPRDEAFATAGLDAARAHMEKVKDAKGNAKKLDELGPVHAHVWAAVVKEAVSHPIAEEDKKVLQKHFEEITAAGSTAADVASQVHVARFKKAWDKKTMKLHLAAQQSLEPVLDALEKALVATGGKRKHGQAPRGGLERQLQEMLDALQ